jgi:hypothetical protein
MPYEKNIVKFKCREIACNLLVRGGDKWKDHCKKKHGFKYVNVYRSMESFIDVSDLSMSHLYLKKTENYPSTSESITDDIINAAPMMRIGQMQKPTAARIN